MRSRTLSRRDFVLTTAGTLVAASTVRGAARAITAQDVADRIRANAGVPWRESSADGLKTGAPATIVTGIATTTMATMSVLQQAVAAGHNFIVSQEPTFYTPTDVAGPRATDPVFLAKQAFIDGHQLVIYRFNDHWNARVPNAPAAALGDALGWARYRAADADRVYRIPETTFGALSAHVNKTLGLRGGLRAAGAAAMRVRTVFISAGTTTVPDVIAHLSQADVVLSGEPREWEVVPYLVDVQNTGAAKGLITIGRVASEEPGMAACATWLHTIVPEVPAAPIAIGDLYWSPTV